MKSTTFTIMFLFLFFATANLYAQVKTTALNDLFENCLISDTKSNISRLNPIIVTHIDETNNRIKTNYTQLENILKTGSANTPWFITQSEEASTIVEIKHVDVKTGWISLGETYSGFFNTDRGETLEFFNPFINYKIINNRPLFKPYPTHISDEYIGYIQSGGIIKRDENDYVLLTPVVFDAHKKRDLYYATSTDLENWTFEFKKIIGSDDISFAKKTGNVFSSGNPLELDNGTFLVLLGIEQPNGNYTSAYMILNKELEILQPPTEIKIPEWHGADQNSFPLSIIKHNGIYRILFHRRSSKFIESEIHEITTKNVLKLFNKNKGMRSSKIIHKAEESTGYLRGKADDASYLIFNSELYILLGSEELPSEYLTSQNREYGLLKFEDNQWIHDQRSPLIVNPVGINNKYPEYEWTSDHLGGFVSPIFHEDYLYIFLTFGTDNPDYYISGIKIKATK